MVIWVDAEIVGVYVPFNWVDIPTTFSARLADAAGNMSEVATISW